MKVIEFSTEAEAEQFSASVLPQSEGNETKYMWGWKKHPQLEKWAVLIEADQHLIPEEYHNSVINYTSDWDD